MNATELFALKMPSRKVIQKLKPTKRRLTLEEKAEVPKLVDQKVNKHAVCLRHNTLPMPYPALECIEIGPYNYIVIIKKTEQTHSVY